MASMNDIYASSMISLRTVESDRPYAQESWVFRRNDRPRPSAIT